MSDVDISKIKPGDKVTVQGVVEATLIRDPSFCVRFGPSSTAWLGPDSVVGHTPTSREIRVGDQVEWDQPMCTPSVGSGTVKAIVDGQAWVAAFYGAMQSLPSQAVLDLKRLRLRHAGAAP